jgi:hypothetical protein
LSLPLNLRALRARRRAIAEILEARFSVSAFELARRADPAYWASARNDMGRGIYAEAMREKKRLQALPDALLEAETAAIRHALQAGR